MIPLLIDTFTFHALLAQGFLFEKTLDNSLLCVYYTKQFIF